MNCCPVVELVRDRFDLYYVGLFLVDETGSTPSCRRAWAPAAPTKPGKRCWRPTTRSRSAALRWWVGASQSAGPHRTRRGQGCGALANRLLPETAPRWRCRSSAGVSNWRVDDSIFTGSRLHRGRHFHPADHGRPGSHAIENARLNERTQVALKEMEATQRRYVQKRGPNT